MLELLLLSTQKKHPPGSPTFNIHLEGHTILPSKSVTILRMVFQADRESTILVNKLKTTTGQVAHMIRRIATKTQGMGKDQQDGQNESPQTGEAEHFKEILDSLLDFIKSACLSSFI
ncbi:hypothetical protein HPB47_000023 [Ixodes persulcatus]|uniref:Uncharacterized protein n=1 Tax=Ixodes persulcatus TaxID=34615 RepID=A0AC60PSY1_IXOPE|nr:hypothetical protein HPB47_000023 [Ixodes persulcatus]